MTFQVTGGDPPAFQQTLQSGPTRAIYALVGISPSSDTIDLFTGGSTLLGSRSLGTERVASDEGWRAIGSFSVTGLLRTSPSDTGIPITMSANVSGGVTNLRGDPSTWVGGYSGTVNSIAFPAGTPASQIQDSLNAIGGLSRFHINGSIYPGRSAQPFNVYLAVELQCIPDGRSRPRAQLVSRVCFAGLGLWRAPTPSKAVCRRLAH